MRSGDECLTRVLHTLGQVAISVDLEPTLQILLESLHELVPFDAGAIFVRESSREVVRARATRGYPPAFEMPASLGVVGAVVASGRVKLVRDVASETGYVAVRPSTAAQLAVPLSSSRGIFGAISLESDRTAAFDEPDVELVTVFARQATIVIERALLHEQLMRQSRLQREIEIAGEILQGLSPTAAPTFPGLQVCGRSLTAGSVGGDAFDFVPYPENQVGVSIADARGKGLPAALVAVAHCAMLRGLASVDLRLRTTLGRISDVLARSLPSGHFITAFYGVIDVTERSMMYANAGHPPPLVVRKNGTIELLDATGPPLGFSYVAPMREGYAVFHAGDGLVLYTDGVTEAGPSPDEYFDLAGVQATVKDLWTHDVSTVCNGLLEEVTRRGNGELSDDATVVVVKFE
jgi:phosphoserine phosphatase RsbU/P